METEDQKIDDDPEWEDRTLCPDGNCIGVIGPDGRCRECGISYGNPTEGAQRTPKTVDTLPCDSTPDLESDPEWENRKLCPDGNCIGIIGSDGLCKECGKKG